MKLVDDQEEKNFWRQYPKSNALFNSWWFTIGTIVIFCVGVLLNGFSYDVLKIIACVLGIIAILQEHYRAQVKL